MLQAIAAAGIGGAAAVPLAASAGAASPSTDWSAFDPQVQLVFDRMQLVGGAVAVVSSDKVLHTMTLGSRTLQPRRSVTEQTRLRVGSTTKSMTSAFVATYVDEGKLGWDQPVIPGLRVAAWRAVWGCLQTNRVYAARYRHLTTRESNKLTPTQAQTAVAGAILRQLYAVVVHQQAVALPVPGGAEDALVERTPRCARHPISGGGCGITQSAPPAHR